MKLKFPSGTTGHIRINHINTMHKKRPCRQTNIVLEVHGNGPHDVRLTLEGSALCSPDDPFCQ